MIVYISVENSDDKIPQPRWVDLLQDFDDVISDRAVEIDNVWFTHPAAPGRGACWCADVWDDELDTLKAELVKIAEKYGQHHVTWSEANMTFLRGCASPDPEGE